MKSKKKNAFKEAKSKKVKKKTTVKAAGESISDTGVKAKKSLRQRVKFYLQVLLLLILLAVAIGIFWFYFKYGKTILELQTQAKKLVRTSSEETFRESQTSIVYDADGNIISTLKSEKDVYYINYEEIPQAAIDALIVSEDKKFLTHDGVDYLANLRAAIALIKNRGEITQGASTITQQLARNIFLTHEVTYKRKIEEIFIAQELEKKYSKFDILEFYFNGIYFANGHYGIQAAAQGYFGKGVNGLSLSQIVFLCAIPNNPNRYNPVTNMDRTLDRRDRLLLQMLDENKITLEEYKDAISEKIELHLERADKKNYVETYIYYSAIRALMKQEGFEFRTEFTSEEDEEAYEDKYYELYYQYQKDLYLQGYRIYTSIDLKKQEQLQNAVDTVLADFQEVNEEGIYQFQGAAVSIDNDNGKVVAIVGGREQEYDGYTLNRAFQSYRQPGSAIKPLIVYTPAFEREYTPDSEVIDKKVKGGPKNSDGSYVGKMKLQRAIELSKNTIAWSLFEELTPQVGLAYLKKMNFAKITYQDYVPAAALGGLTYGASPVEMTAAFATLANDGFYREPTCIIKITDAEGKEIVEETPEELPIYRTRAARIMTEALTGVMERGTARGLGLKYTVSAGKTGTTNDKKDGWFVGYTPYYTTGVWVGYDLPKKVDNLKGASYPGQIWHKYMEQIHDATMTKKFLIYDWRAELKQAEEEAKRLEELMEDEEEAAEDVIDEPEDSLIPEHENEAEVEEEDIPEYEDEEDPDDETEESEEDIEFQEDWEAEEEQEDWESDEQEAEDYEDDQTIDEEYSEEDIVGGE